jgi:hypothetical protein
MSVEQWVALLGVVVLIIGAIAGLTKAIGDLVTAFRRRDTSPAPEVGIPAAPDNDIDFRAYEDMREDRDYWRDIAMSRAQHLDEDTEPLT